MKPRGLKSFKREQDISPIRKEKKGGGGLSFYGEGEFFGENGQLNQDGQDLARRLEKGRKGRFGAGEVGKGGFGKEGPGDGENPLSFNNFVAQVFPKALRKKSPVKWIPPKNVLTNHNFAQ